MAVNFKAVIDDKTKFPDDATFTLAGEQITFGELRRQNIASRGELEQQMTARAQELDQKEATQRRAVDTLARVMENISTVTGLSYDQLVRGQIPEHMRGQVQQITRETRTDSGMALKDDPLYKPLFDGVLAPMSNDVGLLKQALGQAIGAYKNDHTRLDWMDFLMSGEKPDSFNHKYEDVLQAAVNKGYKDELGFPDMKRAARELAGPIVAKGQTDKIRKEGWDEGYRKAQQEFLGQMGQPTPGTGGISFEAKPEQANARTLTIREKLDEAFNDPNIAGQLFGGSVQ